MKFRSRRSISTAIGLRTSIHCATRCGSTSYLCASRRLRCSRRPSTTEYLFSACTFGRTSRHARQSAVWLQAGFSLRPASAAYFVSNVRVAPALAKYWTLVVLSGTLSFVLIRFFLRYISTGVVSAKLIAETILFFVNFILQRDVVFAPNRERRALTQAQSVFLHHAPACEGAVRYTILKD